VTQSVESVLKGPKDEVLFGRPQSPGRFPAKEDDGVWKTLRHGIDKKTRSVYCSMWPVWENSRFSETSSHEVSK
jgi:hypothetical protein